MRKIEEIRQRRKKNKMIGSKHESNSNRIDSVSKLKVAPVSVNEFETLLRRYSGRALDRIRAKRDARKLTKTEQNKKYDSENIKERIGERKIDVVLTTWEGRLNKINDVVKVLSEQTVLVDSIIIHAEDKDDCIANVIKNNPSVQVVHKCEPSIYKEFPGIYVNADNIVIVCNIDVSSDTWVCDRLVYYFNNKEKYKDSLVSMTTYKPSSLIKSVWNIELDLLNEFDRVCKKHNISYFLDAGTLLGAVRNNSFIPWDDDIDVVMFDDEYEKLRAVAKTEFVGKYFFQDEYSDPGVSFYHAKLRNSDTACFYGKTPNPYAKNNCGIFIDIFPMYRLPKKNSDVNKMYSVVDSCLVCKTKSNYVKFVKYMKSISRDSEMCAQLWIPSLTRKIYPISCYERCIYIDFCGKKFPIPENYQEILSIRYGTSWLFPKRARSIHGELFLDPKKSYKKYLWR